MSLSQVVRGHGNKAAGNLKYVKAHLAAGPDVTADCPRALRQHVLDETARRYLNLMGMAEVDKLLEDQAAA